MTALKDKADDETRRMMDEEVPDPNAMTEEDTFPAQGMQPSMMDQTPPQQPMRQQQRSFSEPIAQPPSFAEPIKVNYSQSNIDEIEELVESVVEEKWRTLIENFGDIGSWRERVRTDISSIKQELIRVETRFENLQKAILGKIQSYDENIVEVGSEIKALEKVFKKILDPLITNIKELDRITKKLKK